jgi:hypothetical protein
MFVCDVPIHLESILLSDDRSTVGQNILSPLRKPDGIRKLIVGGMLLGMLTGVCLAQRTSQPATPSARPAPNANTMVAPDANPTVAPDANPTIAPDANPTVAPDANPTVAPDATVGPSDMTQKPPIPPNTAVRPDAAPPSVQH